MQHCWLGLPRSRCRQCTGDNESGFTVVELVIALALMALVMAGLAPELVGAMTATTTANRRTAANGLATAAIEQLRSVTYDTVGFPYGTSSQPNANVPSVCTSSGDPNFGPYASQTPVVLPAGQASALPPGAAPWGTYSVQDTPNTINFTVQDCLYWMNAAGTGAGSPSYKQAVIAVTWTDSAGSHSIRDVSAVYDTRKSVNLAPAFSVDTSLLPPAAIIATPDAFSPGVVDVSWAPSVSSAATDYLVLYDAVDDFTNWANIVVSPPVYGLGYQATGLTPGTAYYFQVVSQEMNNKSCPGCISPLPPTPPMPAIAPPVTTIVNGGGPCTVNSINLSPSSAKIYSGTNVTGNPVPGALQSPYQDIGVTVNASNCSGASLAVQVAGPNNYSYGPLALGPTLSGGTYSATFGNCAAPPNASKWTFGVYTFTVYLGGQPWTPNGSGSTGVVQGSLSLGTSNTVSTSC